MLVRQLAEMWDVLRSAGAPAIELVEAGAGDGQLADDILSAATSAFPHLYSHLRLSLVERSPAARRVLQNRFQGHGDRVRVLDRIPTSVTGVILANELLDALPVHVVVMTDSGLREIHVGERGGQLAEALGPVSNSSIAEYLQSLGMVPEPGWRIEVGLATDAWIRDAGSALAQGFLLLFDYGHEAAELCSPTHSRGTLMAYSNHTADARHWLETPGESDLTAHVNLTAVRRAAESAGLTTLGAVDQTYFLTSLGIATDLDGGSTVEAIRRRLAAKSLVMPGGLGSTMKVLAFAKKVGSPTIRGMTTGRLT
jgi:SAM-dependent MidA family methyltransferase